MPVVIYEGANLHTLSAGPSHRVRLTPGRNDVPKAAWEALKLRSKGLAALEAGGLVRVVDLETNDGQREERHTVEGIDITNYSVRSASDLIREEMDLDVLRRYRVQELANPNTGGARKSLLDVIDRRITLLETPPQPPAEPENEQTDPPPESAKEPRADPPPPPQPPAGPEPTAPESHEPETATGGGDGSESPESETANEGEGNQPQGGEGDNVSEGSDGGADNAGENQGDSGR